MRVLIPLLAALCLAAPAIAAEPATPAEIATARAEADRIIADGAAGDLFTNVTDGRVPAIRHTRSGMVCTFELGARNRITVFNSNDRVPRGDDVGCSTAILGDQINTYATRYPDPVTAEQIFEGTVASIGRTFQNVSAYKGETISIQANALPAMHRATLLAEINGQPVYTEAIVAHHGQWSFKLRLTGDRQEIEASQLLASLRMSVILSKAIEAPGTN